MKETGYAGRPSAFLNEQRTCYVYKLAKTSNRMVKSGEQQQQLCSLLSLSLPTANYNSPL